MSNRIVPLSAALLLCLQTLAGCAADEQAAEHDEIGRLALPLVSSSATGAQYALAATFDLVGPEVITTTVAATDATFLTQDVITLNPRVGTYALTISSFTLYRVNAAMTPPLEPVAGASLVSAATQSVEILRDQTTSVLYSFSAPGDGTIVFARGTLNIDFDVSEGLPVGAACSASSQCASLVCLAATTTCAAPSCSDGVQNGAETSPDCGGGCTCGGGGLGSPCDPATTPPGCAAGFVCVVDAVGEGSCQAPPGGTTACNAAQQAECAAGDSCSVDLATGAVSCTATAVACSGQQALTCANDAICTVLAGAITCTGGTAADANLVCVKINEVSTTGATGAGSDELLELYNTCATDASLGGGRLVYQSATGTTFTTLHNFAAGTVIPGGGYLLYGGAGYTGGEPLDGSFTTGMGVLGGGVALIHSGLIYDSVGYGTATNSLIEGTVAPAPINGESIARIPNGADTNDNAVDFMLAPRTARAAN